MRTWKQDDSENKDLKTLLVEFSKKKKSFTASEAATELKAKISAVYMALSRMEKSGELSRLARGVYTSPDNLKGK